MHACVCVRACLAEARPKATLSAPPTAPRYALALKPLSACEQCGRACVRARVWACVCARARGCLSACMSACVRVRACVWALCVCAGACVLFERACVLIRYPCAYPRSYLHVAARAYIRTGLRAEARMRTCLCVHTCATLHCTHLCLCVARDKVGRCAARTEGAVPAHANRQACAHARAPTQHAHMHVHTQTRTCNGQTCTRANTPAQPQTRTHV